MPFQSEGDMGVYGIVVLSLFSSGISVILILMCGIAVSSSPADTVSQGVTKQSNAVTSNE